jgi:hypothetical protein
MKYPGVEIRWAQEMKCFAVIFVKSVRYQKMPDTMDGLARMTVHMDWEQAAVPKTWQLA